MENKFKLPFIGHKNTPSEKHSDLVQIIIVISSGILSSTAIATVLKAWIDNRKTTLLVQIDGDNKKLEYQGHHLKQDAAAIQDIVEKMSEESQVVQALNTVTIELTDDEPKEEYALETSSLPEQTIHNSHEQTVNLQHPSLLKRLLPDWSLRKPTSNDMHK
jgi:hypothetical protein